MRDNARTLRLMLATAFRSDPPRTIGAALLISGGSLLTILLAYWLKLMADGILEGDERSVLLAAAALAASAILSHLFIWFGFVLRIGVGERASLSIDRQIVQVTTGMPGLEHHERADYQNQLTMLHRQREAVLGAVGVIANNIALLVRAVATVVLLATIHPLLVLLPIFGIPSLITGGKAAKRTQDAVEETIEKERLSDHLFKLATSPAAGKELRIFSTGRELRSRHASLWSAIDHHRRRGELKGAMWSGFGWTAFGLGYVAAILFVGWRASLGLASPGEILMAIVLAGQVNGQVQRMVQLVTVLGQALQIAGKFLWLLDYAREAAQRLGERIEVPSRISSGIVLEGVSFQYPGSDAPALSGVSLSIPAGKTLALVGDNGAGKTTLVKLLLGYYRPTEGSILVDGIDLANFDVAQWRAMCSGGFQDFARFEFLAREAVGVGELSSIADTSAVIGALERAEGSDVLTVLPQGLETQLGRSFDDGMDLSGGQWQKIALGRAMMRPAPILLVLDEPTASLDAETEHALFERYASAAKSAASSTGGITVLVSHRFSTVRMADLIAVIDGGRVIELGSHEQLISLRGTYAELFQLQARGYAT